MCPSLTGALPDLTGNEHGKIVGSQRPPHPPALLPDGKDTKNYIDGTNCVLSLQKCTNKYANNTRRQIMHFVWSNTVHESAVQAKYFSERLD